MLSDTMVTSINLNRVFIEASVYFPNRETTIQIPDPKKSFIIRRWFIITFSSLLRDFELLKFNRAQIPTEILVASVTPSTPINLLKIILNTMLTNMETVLFIIGFLESPYAY